MIDNLALLISHGLVLLTCWRLLSRSDLDRDPDPAEQVVETPSPAPDNWRRRG